jgi:hypothetical protein
MGQTTYTEELGKKDMTLKEFTLMCAHSFDMLMRLHEESVNTEIPEFKPSNLHLDIIHEAQKKILELQRWTALRAEREAKKYFNDQVRSNEEQSERNRNLGKRYLHMLEKVASWVPPTEKHKALKSFMVDQLAVGIKDCLDSSAVPKWLSGPQYRDSLIKEKRHDIVYHTREYKKEVERTRVSNEWVHILKDSLSQ